MPSICLHHHKNAFYLSKESDSITPCSNKTLQCPIKLAKAQHQVVMYVRYNKVSHRFTAHSHKHGGKFKVQFHNDACVKFTIQVAARKVTPLRASRARFPGHHVSRLFTYSNKQKTQSRIKMRRQNRYVM